MITEIIKSPLRPGLSYPLRPSVLEALLATADVTTPIVLHQRSETWWTKGVLFRADFYAPGFRDAPKGDTLHLTCRSVASEDRLAAREGLETEILPAFILWLKAFEGLPASATARREQASFVRAWPEQ